MKPTVVIPTYWTKPDGEPTDRLFNIYDHPTPLYQMGTLPRLLDSLRQQQQEFFTVIIGTVTEPELKEEFERQIKGILNKFTDLKPILFTFSQLERLHERMKELKQIDLVPDISLEGYSNIRNLCLIIPHILGSSVAVLIDDDEVFVDENCLSKATEFVGGDFDGQLVYAKAGYYTRNKEGGYLGSDDVPWWDRVWKKGWAMNQVLKEVKQPPRLKPTSVVFGGLMVIHRKVFEKVAFDPYVVRGEDIDYLINAKMQGFEFFLDNELSILHKPPPKRNHTLGLRQDIYRFVYEQRKLKYGEARGRVKVALDDLDPFPGLFLRKNIVFKSFMISLTTSLRDILQSDFFSHLRNIKVAVRGAPRLAKKNCHKYFGFRHRWQGFMEEIKEDEVMKRILLGERATRQDVESKAPAGETSGKEETL